MSDRKPPTVSYRNERHTSPEMLALQEINNGKIAELESDLLHIEKAIDWADGLKCRTGNKKHERTILDLKNYKREIKWKLRGKLNNRGLIAQQMEYFFY